MLHNVYTFFSPHNCLDEDFDAPDAMADTALCRAIVAGRCGVHPEAWSTRSGLTAVMPQGFHGYEWVPEAYRRPIARSAAAIAEQRRENTEWEARHRRRPVEEPPRERKRPGPKPRPPVVWERSWRPTPEVPDKPGEVQLTCDECRRVRFDLTLPYRAGQRPAAVAAIRLMGRTEGWTCIVGRDRCPTCSHVAALGLSHAAAPEPVGNGAGKDEGDKQDGERGQ